MVSLFLVGWFVGWGGDDTADTPVSTEEVFIEEEAPLEEGLGDVCNGASAAELSVNPKTIEKTKPVQEVYNGFVTLTAKNAPIQIMEMGTKLESPNIKWDPTQLEDITKEPLAPNEDYLLKYIWIPEENTPDENFLWIKWKDTCEGLYATEKKTVISAALTIEKKEKETIGEPIYSYRLDDGKILGAFVKEGFVLSITGEEVGKVGEDGLVYDLSDPTQKIGSFSPPAAQKEPTPEEQQQAQLETAEKAYDLKGQHIGYILETGEVVNKAGLFLGTIQPDGAIISPSGKLIGRGNPQYQGALPALEDLTDVIGADLSQSQSVDGSPAELRALSMRLLNMRGGGQQASDGEVKSGQSAMSRPADEYWDLIKKEKLDAIHSTLPQNYDTSTIRVGKAIPAVLVTSVIKGSSLPVVAMVERNMFGDHGRNIIIPAGSRIIGKIDPANQKEIGANGSFVTFARLQIVWEKLVRPDGATFVFESPAKSGDAQGREGVPGRKDPQLLQKYAAPLMTSTVTALLNLLLPLDGTSGRQIVQNSETGNQTIQESVSSEDTQKTEALETLTDPLKEIAKKLLAKGLASEDGSETQQPEPALVVAAGTRIHIYPSKDIVLTKEADLLKEEKKEKAGE